MKKQRITEGAILEISIQGQYYVYAQILTKGLGFAFFDYKSDNKLIDLNVLKDAEVLFIVAVYNSIVNKGHWEKVGKLDIRNDLKVLPMKFIQDALDSDKFSLYNPNTGEITKTTKQQCKGLECVAVWAANHVEDRIRDHYEGIPNLWLQQLEII